jgi:hypothetical protein
LPKILNDKNTYFVTQINEILFYEWDPINISKSDWPIDEYETYAKAICDMISNKVDIDVIAHYLNDTSNHDMHCGTNIEDDRILVAKIMRLKKHL